MGRVTLDCDVTAAGKMAGCVVVSEYPQGHRLGEGALRMSRLFQMKPLTQDGQPVGGAVVRIPIAFGQNGTLPPEWVRPPTPEEMLAVWPQGAPDTGVADLNCVVTTKGSVSACRVVSESPPRAGFGAAALKLAPTFVLKPPTVYGSRSSGDVELRLVFAKPRPQQTDVAEYGPLTALRNAPWAAAPTSADMAAAWPKAAPDTLEFAKVRLQCGISPDTSLTGCTLLSEDPLGLGFGAAALALVSRFRTRGVLTDQGLLKTARVILPITFVNPKKGSASPEWLTHPNWVSFIPADRMTSLYPVEAAKAGIKTGRAVIVCSISKTGAPTDCGVESEDPPGKGFGPAAMAAITYFVANIWTNGGLPVDGAKIRVPIRFLEPEPGSSPTANPAPKGAGERKAPS